GPPREARIDTREEARTLLVEDGAAGWIHPGQRGEDRSGNRAGILRIEPGVGVAEAVHVHAALAADPGRLRLKQDDAAGDVKVVRSTRRELRVVPGPEHTREPRLVVEPDSHEERGGAEISQLTRLH